MAVVVEAFTTNMKYRNSAGTLSVFRYKYAYHFVAVALVADALDSLEQAFKFQNLEEWNGPAQPLHELERAATHYPEELKVTELRRRPFSKMKCQ